MSASDDDLQMGDSPAADAPYNPELLTTITFTSPPPSLTLAEYTRKAIAEFDVVLDSYLDECYMPMWRGLQALVSHLVEQTTQQQQNTEHLEQQRHEQREQSTAQEGRLDRVEYLLNKLLSRPQHPTPPPLPPPQTYASALQSGLLSSPPDRELPKRLTCEILIHHSNTEKLHPETLIWQINNAKKPLIYELVIAIHQLPSENLIITADSADTKR